MHPILTAYLTCALWSSTNEDGKPLDDKYEVKDFAPESVSAAEKEIEDFINLLQNEGISWGVLTPEQFGNDFWLTRNRHGAGFWDRGLGELGKRLTEWAHTYGSSDAYVRDDEKVYLS